MIQTPKEHYEAGAAALNRARGSSQSFEGRILQATIAQAHFSAGLLRLALPPEPIKDDVPSLPERKGGF